MECNYDWNRLVSLGFSEETVKDLKKLSKNHKEGDIATAEMTPNYLPEEPIPGGGDLKNPQMGEQKIRMPRMEEIAKASNRNGHLAMAAAPNYDPTDDKFRERPGARRLRERRSSGYGPD